jgi:hypothetical protein
MMTLSYHVALDFIAKYQPSHDTYRDMSEIENFLHHMKNYTEPPNVELEKTYKE